MQAAAQKNRDYNILSTLLSIFGLGQNHAHAVSAKFAEASKLNAQFELNLNNAIDLLRSEQVHFRHRIAAMCEHPEDEEILLSQIEPLIGQLISETEVGLATSLNTQNTIKNSSRFASIRKWDECLSLLHRHVAASRHQLERVERAIGQLHRVLDNAETDVSSLEGFDVNVEAIDSEK